MKNIFKVRNGLMGIGLLVMLIAMYIALGRISVIEEKLVFNHYWMIVKKSRADEHQQRIERLEKIVNERAH